MKRQVYHREHRIHGGKEGGCLSDLCGERLLKLASIAPPATLLPRLNL
jgi:hypothetical protein